MFLLHTACNELRRRLRDPLALLLWLGIPLAIGGLISLAFGGGSDGKGPKAEVWVVDQDDSFLSGMLLNVLAAGAEQGMPIVASEVTLEVGERRIENGEGSALLIIPEGFGRALLHEEACALSLITNPSQRILPEMVEESLQLLVDAVFYVQRILGEPIQRIVQRSEQGASPMPDLEVAEIAVLISQAIGRVEKLIDPPLIKLQLTLIGEQEAEAADEDTPSSGFAELFFPSMLFMALFFMDQGISEDYWVEKEQGTLRRIMVTPNRVWAFLAGKLLGSALLIGLVGLFGLLMARFAFGVQVHNFALAALWAGLAGAFLLLLVLPLQLYASSQRAGGLISNLVMMPLLMLGGSFFPFAAMPEGMAAIGRMTPNGWVLTQFQDIILDQVLAGKLALSALAVVLVGGLLFALAQRRLAGPFGGS